MTDVCVAKRTSLRVGLTLAVLAAGVGCSHVRSTTPEVGLLLAEMGQRPPPSSPPALWSKGQVFNPDQVIVAPRGRDDAAGLLWQRFRTAYPFGLQGIAVSAVRPDGSCSIVIGEPPPHVTLEELRTIIPDAAVFRHPVGNDGALFDVAGNLAGGAERIQSELRLLNLLLFRTDYHAFVYQEPFGGDWRDGKSYHLDVDVSPAELHGWVYAPEARFEPLDGRQARTRTELASDVSCDVYRIPGSALVAWRIPQSVSVQDCLPQIRVFALASDLIVGATREDGVMVLGRQRIAPVDVMPPLRAETVALLAAVKDKDELQQSFERLAPGAGIYTADWDWAPILLSPELVDTEYGYLLNETDQLLKGWTQHGRITYMHFEYPQPAGWPFDDALSEILRRRFNTGSLTFNWNTTGAGYVVRLGNVDVYALSRTGALPVSYIPGENPVFAPPLVSYEDQSYDWYSHQENPTFARVVSYAALFQAFHNLGVTALPEPPPSSSAPAQAYASTMKDFWQDVADLNEDAVLKLAAGAAYVNRRMQPGKAGLLVEAGLVGRVMHLLAEEYADWQEIPEDDLRSIERATSALPARIATPLMAEDLAGARQLLSTVAARDKLPERFAASVPANGRSWIHTPLVVMSRAKGNLSEGVGGHNVRADVTKFSIGHDVEVGHVKVVGGVVHLNPEDAARASGIVRDTARSVRAGEPAQAVEARLSRLLSTSEQRQPRPAAVALRTGGTSPPDELPHSERVIALGPSRANLSATVARTLSEDRAATNRVVFMKAGDHVWVKGPYAGEPVLTSNAADASELAAARLKAGRAGGGTTRRSPPELQFIGFSDSDRESVLADIRADSQREAQAQDVLAVISDEHPGVRKLSSVDYDFQNAKIHVDEPLISDGVAISKVTVKIPARRSGVKAAIVRFLIRIKSAVADSRLLADFTEAVRIRIERICRPGAMDGAGRDVTPWILLQRDIQRVARVHGLDVEMQVEEAAGDWHLVLRAVSHHRA